MNSTTHIHHIRLDIFYEFLNSNISVFRVISTVKSLSTTLIRSNIFGIYEFYNLVGHCWGSFILNLKWCGYYFIPLFEPKQQRARLLFLNDIILSGPLVYLTVLVKQDRISLTTQQYSKNFLSLNHICTPFFVANKSKLTCWSVRVTWKSLVSSRIQKDFSFLITKFALNLVFHVMDSKDFSMCCVFPFYGFFNMLPIVIAFYPNILCIFRWPICT